MPSTVGLAPGVAQGLRVILDVLRGLGYAARFTSGFRSPAKQRELYAKWRAGLSPYPVAKPGRSRHEVGLAVDVASDAPDEILRFAGDVAGLRWYGRRDRVHFSVDGR